MPEAVPVAVLSTIDPIRRDAVAMSTVLDRPGTVVIRHDLDGDGEGLHRVVIDSTGVLDDVVVPLVHVCMSCAVREDAIPTIDRLTRDGHYDAVVLALPVGADSLPVTRTLAPFTEPGAELAHVRISSVVAAVDLDTLVDDLLGDDTLADRGLAVSEDDERTVGEAFAAQLAHADLIRAAGAADQHPVASDLLDQVRAADGARFCEDVPDAVARMFAAHHDTVRGEHRTDPRRVVGSRQRSPHGVWTLALRTRRPFHPDRLMDNAEHLGSGRIRSRGVFWVPTRPDSLCAWDGAGGQLSIGDLGPWGLDAPRTELVVTGVGDEEERIRAAFDKSLLTPEELAEGLVGWLGREDVLAPWLGERS